MLCVLRCSSPRRPYFCMSAPIRVCDFQALHAHALLMYICCSMTYLLSRCVKQLCWREIHTVLACHTTATLPEMRLLLTDYH